MRYLNYIIVTIGNGEEFAFHIEKAKEVVEYAKVKITPLPQNNDEGVISLREELISISDLGTVLGFPIQDEKGIARRIVIDTNKCGYIVENAREVLNIDNSCIVDSPKPTEICKKIAKINDRVISIIDL